MVIGIRPTFRPGSGPEIRPIQERIRGRICEPIGGPFQARPAIDCGLDFRRDRCTDRPTAVRAQRHPRRSHHQCWPAKSRTRSRSRWAASPVTVFSTSVTVCGGVPHLWAQHRSISRPPRDDRSVPPPFLVARRRPASSVLPERELRRSSPRVHETRPERRRAALLRVPSPRAP